MLPLANPEVEIAMAGEIMRKNLSVREVEERVRRMRNEDIPDGSRRRSGKRDRAQEMYYRDAELRLSQDLGRKVTISPCRKKGKLTLEYYDIDDLNALLAALNAMGRRKGKGGKTS